MGINLSSLGKIQSASNDSNISTTPVNKTSTASTATVTPDDTPHAIPKMTRLSIAGKSVGSDKKEAIGTPTTDISDAPVPAVKPSISIGKKLSLGTSRDTIPVEIPSPSQSEGLSSSNEQAVSILTDGSSDTKKGVNLSSMLSSSDATTAADTTLSDASVSIFSLDSSASVAPIPSQEVSLSIMGNSSSLTGSGESLSIAGLSPTPPVWINAARAASILGGNTSENKSSGTEEGKKDVSTEFFPNVDIITELFGETDKLFSFSDLISSDNTHVRMTVEDENPVEIISQSIVTEVSSENNETFESASESPESDDDTTVALSFSNDENEESVTLMPPLTTSPSNIPTTSIVINIHTDDDSAPADILSRVLGTGSSVTPSQIDETIISSESVSTNASIALPIQKTMSEKTIFPIVSETPASALITLTQYESIVTSTDEATITESLPDTNTDAKVLAARLFPKEPLMLTAPSVVTTTITTVPHRATDTARTPLLIRFRKSTRKQRITTVATIGLLIVFVKMIDVLGGFGSGTPDIKADIHGYRPIVAPINTGSTNSGNISDSGTVSDSGITTSDTTAIIQAQTSIIPSTRKNTHARYHPIGVVTESGSITVTDSITRNSLTEVTISSGNTSMTESGGAIESSPIDTLESSLSESTGNTTDTNIAGSEILDKASGGTIGASIGGSIIDDEDEDEEDEEVPVDSGISSSGTSIDISPEDTPAVESTQLSDTTETPTKTPSDTLSSLPTMTGPMTSTISIYPIPVSSGSSYSSTPWSPSDSSYGAPLDHPEVDPSSTSPSSTMPPIASSSHP